ncbi:MAG: radical SAM protein [Verrucomicrobiota bacterium]
MINLTKLYCGVKQPADGLRYGDGKDAPRSAAERKPVVVWNITRQCNLKCIHCYSDSEARKYPGELTWEEIQNVLRDLAQFGIPHLLLSGGEPLMHPRFWDIATLAKKLNLRLTLSTNGTLIDRAIAEKIKSTGFGYVGISLDGIGETHDRFRKTQGAFERAVRAFEHCKTVEQKVGLRLTLSRHTVDDLDRILDFVEKMDIERVCFYHLKPSGRGVALELLKQEETLDALEQILARTVKWVKQGTPREVLTVARPADSEWLIQKMRAENHPNLERALEWLRWNGGAVNGPGVGIGNIDSQGNVHPDQFSQDQTFGNIKEKTFSEIWTPMNKFMTSL